MRISDWSSDVCSSDLHPFNVLNPRGLVGKILNIVKVKSDALGIAERADAPNDDVRLIIRSGIKSDVCHLASQIFEIFNASFRSEEHTSELQSLMRISYAVFCLKKKKLTREQQTNST